jgi:hypothetical protein
MTHRIEHDLLGDREIPSDAYYGVHTLRALENFPITGTPISDYPDLIRALAMIKKAAARANHDLGLLPAPITEAIVAACREIMGGKLADQFVVDVIQGGAGTSTNMNANEVIANRALELLGRRAATTGTCTPTSTSIWGRAPTTCTRPRSRSHSNSPCTDCNWRWPSWYRRSPTRPWSSAGTSRWAAPSSRTPCR